MEEFEIVGICVSTGKEGRVFTRLFLTKPFSASQMEKSVRCEGIETLCEVTTLDCSSFAVGDLVNLVYRRGYQNIAQLSAVLKVQ